MPETDSNCQVSPWGRLPGMHANAVAPRWRSELEWPSGGNVLPFGLGRSYGDSCLVEEGVAIETRHLDRLIEFDRTNGTLRCDSGVSLDTILDVVTPFGWTLPVLPGTQYVSVGGAIANDVHGKNHHHRGSFGDHVRAFELLRTDSGPHICTAAPPSVLPLADGPQERRPDETRIPSPTDLFEATIGGLGLTGLITWAEIALTRLPSRDLICDSLPFRDTPSFIALCEQSESEFEHVVAWIDALSFRGGRYRGILQRARYADSAVAATAPPRRITRFPKSLAGLTMNRWSIRRFNDLYWLSQRTRSHSVVDFRRQLFPLDSIEGWNAMYGRSGFFQFQCVLPLDSIAAVDKLLQRIADSGEGSFLGVIKRFGPRRSRGWLSFPMPGITLALDFPNRGESTRRILADAGDLVSAHGGRIYPAKDACMSAQVFRSGFPRWQQLDDVRDPRFMSRFWQRVAR